MKLNFSEKLRVQFKDNCFFRFRNYPSQDQMVILQDLPRFMQKMVILHDLARKCLSCKILQDDGYLARSGKKNGYL